VRYEEEIIPVPIYVIKYVIKQGYCKHCDKVVYPKVPGKVKIKFIAEQLLLQIFLKIR
jgi:transposase